MPAGKNNFIGVWEAGRFIGIVAFGSGAGNLTNGKRFGLKDNFEVVELTRVALTKHISPVSKIISIALRLFRKHNPGVKLILSLADPDKGHYGGIYQAGGWLYLGESSKTREYQDKAGRWHHERTVGKKNTKKHYGLPNQNCLMVRDAVAIRELPGKHVYAMPLTDEIRASLIAKSKPYPKRVRSDTGDTPVAQTGEGGSTPTRTLQQSEVPCQPAN